MTFQLHPNFANKTLVAELPLCSVLLQDDENYPWLMLIPRVIGASRIMDLTQEDQIRLIKEMDLIQKILWEEFHPTQLNVAAIGNKTPQLHVHVIARFENDPAWPGTVWDHPVRSPYESRVKENILERIQHKITLDLRGANELNCMV